VVAATIDCGTNYRQRSLSLSSIDAVRAAFNFGTEVGSRGEDYASRVAVRSRVARCSPAYA